KDPITDPGKRSKRGRLALIRSEDGRQETIREDALDGRANMLRTVFRNGALMADETLAVIRTRTLNA
ncbi:nicotinate phosphoribosyltransferase, partial [Acinetobacter baumannii]